MIFERFAIHLVDFPYSDVSKRKRRPALLLTDQAFVRESGNAVFAMITSAKHSRWPFDCEIGDLTAARLAHPSMVRMRFMTLAKELVEPAHAALADIDRPPVTAALKGLLSL